MNNISKLKVILFKTNDKSAEKDRYVEFLRDETHLIESVHQINLLHIELINVDELAAKLKLLFNTNAYKILIVTSKQTVEAFENALKQVDSFNRQDKLVVYCVGEATAAKFRQLIAKFDKLSRVNIEIKQTKTSDDQHTQNARQLAKLIIDDYTKEADKHEAYAFYPCSSIRKDDLIQELTHASISFDELNVYKTAHSEKGLSEFSNLIRTFSNEQIVCLVFFSPSGVESLFNNYEKELLVTDNIKLISIGPSTTKSLNKLNLKSYELSSPSPQSLLNILKSL